MAPLTRSQRRALLAVVLAGVAVRVAWAAYAAREPQGLHDPGFYRLLAHQLARLDGYELNGEPTAYYPVGYPAVLAVAFALGRLVGADGPVAETALVVAVNVVASAAAILLTCQLGRLVAGARAGLAAAAVVAAWPNLVLHAAVALTELVFLAVVLAFAVLLAAAPWERGGPGRRRLVVAGLLLGASALVRPVALPVVPLLAAVWWAAGLGWRRAVRDLALLSAAALAAIAPWTVRNAVRLGEPVPISTNTGDNLCMSRQPGATGAFLLADHCFAGPELEGLDRPEYELARDARGRRLAVEFVREHPGRELRLWLDRLGATFRHDHAALDTTESYGDDRFLAGGTRDLVRRAADGFWYVAGPLSLAAGVAALARPRLRRDPRLVLVLACAVGVLVPVVAFFGDARFKVPAAPFLAVLLAAVAAAAVRAWRAAEPAPAGMDAAPAST